MKNCIKTFQKDMITGWEFSDNHSIYYKISVLTNGEIDEIQHLRESDIGDNIYVCDSHIPKEKNFEIILKKAMKSILDNNIEDFKEMQKRLNYKYWILAENLRTSKIEELNF